MYGSFHVHEFHTKYECVQITHHISNSNSVKLQLLRNFVKILKIEVFFFFLLASQATGSTIASILLNYLSEFDSPDQISSNYWFFSKSEHKIKKTTHSYKR